MPERLARHARAAGGEEKRVARLCALPAVPFAPLVARDPVGRLLAERHQALLRALAEHAQHARVEVHLEGLQPPPAPIPAGRWRRAVSSIARSRRPSGVAASGAASSASTSASDSDFGKRGARFGGSSLSVGSHRCAARARSTGRSASASTRAARRSRRGPCARPRKAKSPLRRPSGSLFQKRAELLEVGAVRGDGVLRTARPRATARRRTRRARAPWFKAGARRRSAARSCISSQRFASTEIAAGRMRRSRRCRRRRPPVAGNDDRQPVVAAGLSDRARLGRPGACASVAVGAASCRAGSRTCASHSAPLQGRAFDEQRQVEPASGSSR